MDPRLRSPLPLLAPLLLLAAGTTPLADASHGDGTYDIPNWFEWDQAILDVHIYPPSHGQIANGNGVLGGGSVADIVEEVQPCQNSYMDAMRDSVQDWQDGIDQYGPSWLRNGLQIRVWEPGCQTDIPLPSLLNPEIVILTDENKGVILGVAVSTSPCLVINSKFFITSFTYEDMYNINSQEYGHCLGLNHVEQSHPKFDPMNGLYPQSPGSSNTFKQCVSNLDIDGLEGVFARTLGQPSSLWGEDGEISVSQYQQRNC